tara:strand:- start:943 stop:1500 length:558 start_codon:yes stop_codon:yes gene_type:complete
MNISEKKNLERKLFRKLRDESSINDRRNVENNVKKYVDSFYKRYKQINHIAIYWPLKNEVDIRSLKNNFSLALPKCYKNKSLSFYQWDDKQLTRDYEGILSPANSNLLTFKQISMIFIPCLSVDENLIRLGYGGGYFDRLRVDKNWSGIPCIGLLTSNCVSTIPLTRADWDIPLSGFITEKEILV